MSDDHDDTTSDLDFAMLTTSTRPGPCKAAAASEVDPVEARIERERQAATYIAAAVGLRGRPDTIVNGIPRDCKCIEIRHGSGKVKV